MLYRFFFPRRGDGGGELRVTFLPQVIIIFCRRCFMGERVGKEKFMILFSSNSPCLKQFNVIGWRVVRFPWLDESQSAEL